MGEIDFGFGRIFALLLVMGVAFGWLLFEGLPMLWALVKPWIHVITG